MVDASEQGAPQDPPRSIPPNLRLTLRGFAGEETAKRFGRLVLDYVGELSRYLDLSRLDGMTVAFDYDQALLDLDRGYSSEHRLTPSRDRVLGIAMTPGVLRNGEHKSHILINAAYFVALEDPDHEFFSSAFHLLAHECAHVEVTGAYDRAFPGVLLRRAVATIIEAIRLDVTMACWDEYSACRLSDRWGEDPMPGYLQTFVSALKETRDDANAAIRAYRRHGDIDRLLLDVSRQYGNLMKFAAYFAGALAGRGGALAEIEEAAQALDGHWFEEFYHRLISELERLTLDFGTWQSESDFDEIGDLVIDVLADGGVFIAPQADGGALVDVPFSLGTI